MSDNKRWLAIVNLLSGSGKCGREWDIIALTLSEKGIEFDTVFTERRFHAIDLAVKGITEDGYRNLIAVGGDGTIHEVANGILLQSAVKCTDVRLGAVSVGTGNDWIRMYGIPATYEAAAETIASGQEFLQDVGLATFRGRDGSEQSRYFANITGVGMDAAVNLRVCQMKDKGKNGKLSYLMSLAGSVLGYRSCPMKVLIDGKTVIDRKTLSVTIGIGRYNGGGMMQVPLAEADDGLFDCTVIDDMPPLKVALSTRKLYNGTIYTIDGVNHYRGRKIEISSSEPREMEVDGEPLGTTPVSYELKEKALKVMIPRQ